MEMAVKFSAAMLRAELLVKLKHLKMQKYGFGRLAEF